MSYEPDFIEVTPAPEQRTAFARWAVAADPSMRTVSLNTFAVPYALFGDAPEAVLIGALIDGHLYRHVEEEPWTLERVEPLFDDSDVPLPATDATAEVVVPDDEEEYSDSPFADTEPATVKGEDSSCPDCGNVFANEAGMKRHRTRKH